uniref:Uncharacterized protein n=3 Tax=Aegilops tauschii subsp. strangulata TaxID=200361 RepID=A0A453LQ23_AEGTS
EQRGRPCPLEPQNLSLPRRDDKRAGVHLAMEPAATDPTGDALAAAAAASSLVFLGTGCSGALPDARCLIQPSAPPCTVCSQALSLPPDRNPNYRCNTSLLIDYCHDNDTHKYILIAVGKTFREQVLRWFVHHKVPSVDSVLSMFGWYSQVTIEMMLMIKSQFSSPSSRWTVLQQDSHTS